MDARAHAEIDPALPPRRRSGNLVLVQDARGDVLLVRPTYRRGRWQLPGGGADADEPPHEAAQRELLEETGLTVPVTGVVALDYVPARDGQAEGYNTVFTIGRRLTASEAAAVAIPEAARAELDALRFVRPERLDDYGTPQQVRRIRSSLSAVEEGRVLPILVLGARVAT
ncbi:NUDIX hydrolase [Streptomyces sp. DSM 44915]|uniref:NUDIX hydrolase n=1 Tax=Streptomyces chisholmiae TaxID=3075540 RepID=A0ABU2JR82_9ACTN|nr:NUDIX hydrolase [Streptomyces sp. DSM 44915]MDT0266738.1 NUDIX hydrolase [Streptomyces sp. DSM 44915]